MLVLELVHHVATTAGRQLELGLQGGQLGISRVILLCGWGHGLCDLGHRGLVRGGRLGSFSAFDALERLVDDVLADVGVERPLFA